MTTSASADATASARDELKRVQKSSKSWLTRTKYFQRAIDAAFEQIDVDKSGDVTLEELHAGLLLIHLKMAAYVGAPACKVNNMCVQRVLFVCCCIFCLLSVSHVNLHFRA
jgi:hypothetical protein